MLAESTAKSERAAWLDELRAAYTDPAHLLADLGLSPTDVDLAAGATQRFAFRVPRPYARRIVYGDAGDPLLRQVLPVGAELTDQPDYTADPVGDAAAARVPGLLHKYDGRVLLLLTGGCAVNCRYCFRREYPYQGAVGRARLAEALATIDADLSVREVILSGGDPLMLQDADLGTLARRIAAIPQVRRLRVHTRLPVVLPARVTGGLTAALGSTRLPCVVVIHANHARELDDDVAEACARLRGAGLTLLNQAVLLRGVNDSVESQVALAERLFAVGVLPYYLHQLDRVRGAAHFEVSDAHARALHAALCVRLPGYLVPRLVREVAGAASKLPV